MKDAARTWALVVGIDVYDDPKIQQLAGAARDAVATVRWLRDLGVPDAQILLHARPCADARPEVDALGIPYRGCSEPEIWRSFAALRELSEERLFVVLAGHGLFEPKQERLFLTQEAMKGDYMNLGLSKYVQLMRSMDFRRQFLLMDGCLNYPYSPEIRGQIGGGMHASIEIPPPRKDTTVVQCFAASQSEQALELDDRGLFLSELLRAVDLTHPDRRCLSIDDQAGRYLIGLERAIDDVVGPRVTDRAAASGRPQHPTKAVVGQGEAWPSVPFVSLEPETKAHLTVLVHPKGVVHQLEQIRVRTEEDVHYDKVVPSPPQVGVTLPVTGRLPAGTQLSVRCRVKNGTGWTQPHLREVTLTKDREIDFRLSRTGAHRLFAGEVELTTVDSSGGAVRTLTDEQYSHLQRHLTDTPGIQMVRREIGPVLLRSATVSDERLALATGRLARALDQMTPDDVEVTVEGAAQLPSTGALRIRMPRGGAVALAGMLAGGPVLTVDDRKLSLWEAEGLGPLPVEPGAVDVALALPWGRWTRRVIIEAGGVSTVRLPGQVGLPPLRLPLVSDHRVRRLQGHSLVVIDRSRVAAPQRRSATGALTGEQAIADGAAAPQVFTWPSAAWWSWASFASVRVADPLTLPLHPAAPVIVSLGASPRAEPFSDTDVAAWDLLVSSGQLEALSATEVTELTWGKWADPLLGVAGAYALLPRDRERYLQQVLDNLVHLVGWVPDVSVLMDELSERTGAADARVVQSLAEHERSGAVPVFRWGVPLAIRAAERHGLTTWLGRLREVDRGLVPTSVWTMWRGAAVR